MELRLLGLSEAQRNLANASRLIAAASFAKALDRAAGVFAAEVELRASALVGESGSGTPLAEHVITSVEVDAQGRGGRAQVGFDSSQDERTGKPQDLKALWVEYGHIQLTHKGDAPVKGKKFVPAEPFMRPAFEAAARPALEVFTEAIAESLDSLVANHV